MNSKTMAVRLLAATLVVSVTGVLTPVAAQRGSTHPKRMTDRSPGPDAVDFNVLESAVIDPEARDVELLGRRIAGGPDPIPYRQVLGEAVSYPGPQFSLDSDFSRFTRNFIAGKSLADLMFQQDTLTSFGRVTLAALEVPAPPEPTRAGFTAAVLRQAGFGLAAELREAEGPMMADTVSRWIEILRLVPEYEGFLEATGGHATSNPEAADVFYLRLLRGLGGSLENEGGGVASLYRRLRNGGSPPKPALQRGLQVFLDSYEELLVRSIDILLERHRKPAVIYSSRELGVAFGASPVSRPKFVNLASETQLARLLLEGDYALKSVPFDAELAQIQGYETFPDWAAAYIDRDHLGMSRETRYWLTVESVELRESADGNIASIGDVRLRVESRSKEIDEPWSAERVDPVTKAYADLLTEHFDAIAAQVPALHNLRETAKAITLANWLRGKGLRPSLAGEPIPWVAPREVSGFLAMTPYLREGSVLWGIWPSGGVDFDFASRIVITRDESLTADSVRSRTPADLAEARREKLLGPVAIGRLYTPRVQVKRMRVEAYIREASRTWNLSENLRVAKDGVATLNAFLLETQRLQAAALRESGEAFIAAADYARALMADLGTSVEELTGSDPDASPPVERLVSLAPEVETVLKPLQPGKYVFFSPSLVSELHRVATNPALEELRSGLLAWDAVLADLSRQAPEVYERARRESRNLPAFIQTAGRAENAWFLYQERTRTLRELLPNLTAAAGTLSALEEILERQLAGLEEDRLELEALQG